MGLRWTDWPPEVLATLRRGAVIPAHPLALDANRKLDPRRQRALTRYYLDAGAGGLAVGVHTTQFAIREVGLYRPGARARDATARPNGPKTPPVMIAGLAGRTAQAVQRSADRARPRLSRRPALARRHEGRERGRADRARRDDRARNSAGRLLSAARGRRHRAAGVVLAPLRGDRERRRHQDRAVQPLPHARRDPRRGRGGRRRSHHALYRQRRPHRARSGDAVRRHGERRQPTTVRIKGGLLGHWSVWVEERRRAARRASTPRSRPARSRPSCSRSTRR